MKKIGPLQRYTVSSFSKQFSRELEYEKLRSRENSINWAIFSLPKNSVVKKCLKVGCVALFRVENGF